MAKSSTSFICQDCGAVHPRWSGKCDSCGAWNTIVGEVREGGHAGSLAAAPKKKGRTIDTVPLEGKEGETTGKRHISGMAEFDRVTGGGLVPGSALLIGGDPGIGKSTLLLQIMCAIAGRGQSCLYISGEEAVDQVRLRAKRLGLEKARVRLAAATNVRDIAATLEAAETTADLCVIDSIQTMYMDTVDSAPGTVTQVRACTHELIRLGKRRGITILFVGHVTKEGQIAGPRVLEHMVDTVLYFEGDRGHHFRILRAVKNRFGATDEIGVFEMAEEGLVEVENPSALFLAQRQADVPGSAVLAGLEGTRPLLVEVQALVAPTGYATPRRAVIGWDSGRLAMVLAVLEARCGLELSGSDIYLNIAGGIKLTEPAADLAVAAALISAHLGAPLPHDMVLFGEIGLAGEIRQIAQPDQRLKEAAKLGFHRGVIPKGNPKQGRAEAGEKIKGMEVDRLTQLQDLVDMLQSVSRPGRAETLASI